MDTSNSSTTHSFLDSLRDGVIIVDEAHLIVYSNQCAQELLGMTMGDMRGQEFESFLNLQVDSQPTSRDSSPLSAPDTQTALPQKMTMCRKDRSLLSVQLSIIPKPSRTIVIVHDASADEKIEQAKSEFVALVSHQLRTPINIISWYVEKLLSEKRGELNDHQHSYLDQIALSNKRVVDLVQAIVNVSRTELTRIKHKHELVDLELVLQRVINEVKIEFEHKQHSMDMSVSPANYSLPDSDQELIAVILRNILKNAFQYTPQNGQIRVSLEPILAGQLLPDTDGLHANWDGAIIGIEDSGIGIPDDEKTSVYTKLFRASNVQALDVTGVGIGLYIARRFIDTLGGQIWFTSELRSGTKFWVFIPKFSPTTTRK